MSGLVRHTIDTLIKSDKQIHKIAPDLYDAHIPPRYTHALSGKKITKLFVVPAQYIHKQI